MFRVFVFSVKQHRKIDPKIRTAFCIQKINKTILIILKYIDGVPAIHELKQVSRSSQRVYKPWNRLNLYQQGLGLVLVSTSKGILPSAKAFEYKIGGEVLCQVF